MSILAEENPKPWLGAIIVTLAAGTLYFLTAARDIVVGDTPELITAAATLGVPHEPGYPLFTMLGHVFSLLPFGSIPFRINLLSVTCHALTVGVICLTAYRLTRSQLSSAIAALLIAVNPIFWEWSLAAEVFPLNDVIVASLMWCLLIWHEHPERAGFLVVSAFLAGLGLTNHQTIVLLGPAVCFLLWQHRAALMTRPRIFILAALAFCVGLLPYIYIPWASARHPVYNWGNVSSLSDLLDVIMRKTYGSGRLVAAADYQGGSPLARIVALLASFGWPILFFLGFGLVAAYRQKRVFFWFGVIAFVLAGPIFVWITNLNLATAPSAIFVLQRFFLMPQVILAPFFGFGLLWLLNFGRRHLGDALGQFTVASATLLLVVAMLIVRYPRVAQNNNHIERTFAEDIWRTAKPGSVLIARGDVAFALLYFQKVEHVGTDSHLVMLPLLPTRWYIEQLRSEKQHLTIPFERYDRIGNNLAQFVEANATHDICVVGTIGSEDKSLEQDYWPYQRGLLLVIEPKSKSIPFEQMLQENEQLFENYRPPSFSNIRPETFEMDIVSMYTWPGFRLGNDCLRVGMKSEAQKWFERTLAINPKFSQAREALTRLEH